MSDAGRPPRARQGAQVRQVLLKRPAPLADCLRRVVPAQLLSCTHERRLLLARLSGVGEGRRRSTHAGSRRAPSDLRGRGAARREAAGSRSSGR